MPDIDMEPRVFAVQRNAAAVLALLGGSDDDTSLYWGIVKGLTTPAEWRLLAGQFSVMETQLEQVQASLHMIDAVAKEISDVPSV